MFTTCPKCSLKLVVTAADLRVAQGYVRCGRCSNVFNALAAISDEQQAVLAREPADALREPPAPSEGPASTPPQAPAPAPSSGRTSAPPRAEEPIPDEALEFDSSSTDVSEVFVEPADDDPTGTFESIVLLGDELGESPSSETEDEARASPSPRERTSSEPHGSDALESSETHELEIDLEALIGVTGPPPRPEIAKQPAPEPSERPSHGRKPPEVPAPPRPVAREPMPPATPAPPRPAAREPEARAEAPAAELVPVESEQTLHQEGQSADDAHLDIERILRIGSVALALLLALQIVNHERAELAGISWLRAPLTAVYSALGMPLAPNWNVRAYEVRQLGAVAGNPGALTVRASVTNTAPRDQPLPLLRVTMQDRFGNRVAARDVPPSAYLPAGSSNRVDLAAGQRVDAEIAFADPGPNAVGFEIDACLKLTSGRVACANDAPARATP